MNKEKLVAEDRPRKGNVVKSALAGIAGIAAFGVVTAEMQTTASAQVGQQVTTGVFVPSVGAQVATRGYDGASNGGRYVQERGYMQQGYAYGGRGGYVQEPGYMQGGPVYAPQYYGGGYTQEPGYMQRPGYDPRMVPPPQGYYGQPQYNNGKHRVEDVLVGAILGSLGTLVFQGITEGREARQVQGAPVQSENPCPNGGQLKYQFKAENGQLMNHCE